MIRTWSYLLGLFIWRPFFIIVLIFFWFSNNAHCRLFRVRRNLKAGTFNVACMRIMNNGLTGLKILHVQTQMFWRFVLMLSAGFSIVHGQLAEHSSTPTTIQAGIHMYGTSGLLFSWLVFEAAVYFSSRSIKVPRILYKTSEQTKKLGPASHRRQSTQTFCA